MDKHRKIEGLSDIEININFLRQFVYRDTIFYWSNKCCLMNDVVINLENMGFSKRMHIYASGKIDYFKNELAITVASIFSVKNPLNMIK